MQETEEHDISDVPTDDDALPSSVRVQSRGGDAWYEYDGERVFSNARILDLWDRYQDMAESDWERVSTVQTYPETRRLKVRTKDAEEVQDALDDRANEVNEEFGFLFPKDAILGAHHGIEEKGPRKSVANAAYRTGRTVGLGGEEYKRNKLLLPVRSFEQYVYHNRVWLPVVREYHEKYPY